MLAVILDCSGLGHHSGCLLGGEDLPQVVDRELIVFFARFGVGTAHKLLETDGLGRRILVARLLLRLAPVDDFDSGALGQGTWGSARVDLSHVGVLLGEHVLDIGRHEVQSNCLWIRRRLNLIELRG